MAVFQKRQKSWERRWTRRNSSLIGPKPENRKTLIGTKMCHKQPQKIIFVVWKWSPQEVQFLTVEVVLFLTLERPRRGTETKSPAHIYILYVCMYLDIYTSFFSLSGAQTKATTAPRSSTLGPAKKSLLETLKSHESQFLQFWGLKVKNWKYLLRAFRAFWAGTFW